MLTAICFRFGVEITDEKFESLLDRILRDEDENVGSMQFTAMFDSRYSFFAFSHSLVVFRSCCFNTENALPPQELGLFKIFLYFFVSHLLKFYK